MHLKRLELTGFKSFADKINLDLGPGLNAVVGPNGSGKSNIADALRWVLGETSAKQLRGGNMQDVIFAGTQHRKPLGYAQIVMHLDNTDGKLPIDFKEVQVSRRVYRSGESEYMINGAKCRLRDIQELFMDTGIGRDGYSIIGQGRVDEILSAKSEDRRQVFEEAAGISKFKARRNEALNKLEKERENLDRVNDIIAELSEQIEPLRIQAEEAKRFLELRDKYKSIHINIYLNEIEKISRDLSQIEETYMHSFSQSKDTKEALDAARALSEELKVRLESVDESIRVVNEALLDASNQWSTIDGEVKLLENKTQTTVTECERLDGEIKKRYESIDEKTQEKNQEALNHQKASEELNDLNKVLQSQMDRSEKLAEMMRESERIVKEHHDAIQASMDAAQASRTALIEAENVYARLEEDMERLSDDIDEASEQYSALTMSVQEQQETLEETQSDLKRAQNSEKAFVNAYNTLYAQSNDLITEVSAIRENLTALKGKHRALVDLDASQEGFYRSVKYILRKKQTDTRLGGIHGAVGELIGVDAQYDTAIEIALGSSAQSIVTDNENDAKVAIDMLKTSGEGRATFLPLSAVKGKSIDTNRFKKEAGFIGVASELIHFEPIFEKVIASLLGDILIIDTMDHALLLHKKFNYSQKIVTLSGERLSPGGAITGGSMAKKSTGFIGRTHQIQILKEEIAAIQVDFDKKEISLKQVTDKLSTTHQSVLGAKEAVQTLSIEAKRLEEKIAELTAEADELKTLNEDYEQQTEELMQSIVDANKVMQSVNNELIDNEARVVSSRAALDEYNQSMINNRDQSDQEAMILSDMRVSISQQEGFMHHATDMMARLDKDVDAITKEITYLQGQLEKNIEVIANNNKKTEVKNEALNEMQSKLDALKEQLSQTESEKSMLTDHIRRLEKEERESSETDKLLEKELTRLEGRKESLTNNAQRAHEEMWEEYNLTHAQAMEFKRDDISETQLRRTGLEIKTEINALGSVNVGAIEAYKQLTARFDFLTAQRNDIEKAEESLTELITNLTTQMEKQFSEKFAEIAKHFNDVYVEMFRGGRASLKIVDTANVLESGIEITAQPPGKSLQTLTLLSGGERALTAIALLFAILRMKPSPFCVLDEIETALDDANVDRFANFLKQYAKGTQFIIITHRKGTMEAADNLYGVTMQEQGVSKLVSVKLVDEAA